jgi:Tfp pilus assembly PilM family ATPase
LRSQLQYPLNAQSAANDPNAGSERAQRLVYEPIRPIVDELANELGLCLRYYSVTFHGQRPEQVSLIGGEARQPWLAPLLADTAGVAVSTIDPIDQVATGRAQNVFDEGPHAEWAVAAGLSLRGQSVAEAEPRQATAGERAA